MVLRHFQICCYLQLNTQSENINLFIDFSIMICIKILKCLNVNRSPLYLEKLHVIRFFPTYCSFL